VLVIFAIVFCALGVGSYVQKSATWDEPIHLTAGFAALAESDFRVDPSHPPLARVWAALPIFFMGVTTETSQIDRTDSAQWLTLGYGFAHEFLYRIHDADHLLMAARFMALLWGVFLGVLLFLWAKEWLGFVPAVLVLVFYTIEPNIGAHSRLVTTDMAATSLTFGAVYFLWRTVRRPALSNVAGFVVCVSLAFVAKFSGVLLIPIMLTLMLVAVLAKSRLDARLASGIFAVTVLSVFATIWLSYDFRYEPSLSRTWLFRVHELPEIRARVPVLADMVEWVDERHLLPNAFSQGFLLSQGTARLSAYLDGEVSSRGWPEYFIVAFFVKTPATMILFFLTGIVLIIRRRGTSLLDSAFIALPIIIFMCFAAASRINIGLRHILPVYPFVILIAAAGAREVLAWYRPIGRYVFATLMAVWMAMFLVVYPDLLSFFNLPAGGPSKGLNYLADSNLDWGQDLKSLKQWLAEKNIDRINLAYFGTADPSYYDIACTYLPGAPFFASDSVTRPDLPGYVAISATILSGVYLEPPWRLFYRGFLNEEPVAVIGNSIRVYWVERWPEADPETDSFSDSPAALQLSLADALQFQLNWPDHAVIHYREGLRDEPETQSVLANFGLALFDSGEMDQAIDVLRRAVSLDRANGPTRIRLAAALLKRRRMEEGKAQAQRAVELSPDDAVAHDLLGVAFVGVGELESAKESFEKALALEPEYFTAQEHLRLLDQMK
jgi:tetratricopeptide (TPR) repeat protein